MPTSTRAQAPVDLVAIQSFIQGIQAGQARQKNDGLKTLMVGLGAGAAATIISQRRR
jgi:hypothetical protein